MVLMVGTMVVAVLLISLLLSILSPLQSGGVSKKAKEQDRTKFEPTFCTDKTRD
jgi:hypothetical protein